MNTWYHTRFFLSRGKKKRRKCKIAAAVTGKLCVIGAKLDRKAIAALFGCN